MNDFSPSQRPNPPAAQPNYPAGNRPQPGYPTGNRPQTGAQPNAAPFPGGPQPANPMGAMGSAGPMGSGTPMPYAPAPVMPQAPYMPRPAKKGPNGFAIAGLVVSLIAIFVVLERFSQYVSPFGVVGLILSILGYMVNMDDEGEGRSRTARIFAIVGGVLSLITIVITLLVGLFNPNLSSGLWF